MRTSTTSNSEGLERDEATKLLTVCMDDENEIRGKRDLALFSIMIFNGLRRSEVIQINLDKIKKVGDVNTTTLTIKRGKELTIEFIPHVWKVIEDWLEVSGIKNGCLFRRLKGGRGGAIYLSDKCLTDDGLYRITKLRIEEAGIKKNIHPHSLRHTYATLALLAGVPIQDVQVSMGHSSTDTTFRYYRAIDQVGRSPGRKIDIEMPKGKGEKK
jgi:integrase